jgi:hypothetical protein
MEITLRAIVRYLRKSFQWLITAEDIIPQFDKANLEKFFKNSYDPELGWVRKSNTSGTESLGSLGALSGHHERAKYNINEFGARRNPGHEDLPKMISTYGDSFTFCRQVNDDQTWQWYLSRLTQTNISNFGVGNYGIDQAYLRLKREYGRNKTQIVIMGVVPETIVRILSAYKHYFEYGNTFAFKPRFILENHFLRLLPNSMDRQEKYFELDKYITEIQGNDYFYKNKFKKDMLIFPYVVSVFRNPFRNIPIIYCLLLRKIYQKMGKNYDRPWELILKENRKYCISLYKNKDALNLMVAILKEFAAFGREKGFTPVLLLLPYKLDIEYFQREGRGYYQNLLEQASSILTTIDLAPYLSSLKDKIYINDFYGGHTNPSGNEAIASVLYEILWRDLIPNCENHKTKQRLSEVQECARF